MSLSILNEELERFYSEKFYFSYSSINKLLFSPRVFYNHYILKQKEDSTDAHLIAGRALHCLLLEPDKFDDQFVLLPGKIPTDSNKVILDHIFKNHYIPMGNNALSLDDFPNELLAQMLVNNLYQSLKTDVQRLEKIITENNKEYFEFLKIKEAKTVIDSTVKAAAEVSVEVIKSDKNIMALLQLGHNNSQNVYVHNELKLQSDSDNYDFGYKGIIDNVVVDENIKTVFINDLKTTNKSIQDFPNSVDYYRYDIQAVIYNLLVYNQFIKNRKDVREWKMVFTFIVIDKYNLVYPFQVSEETLANWESSFYDVINKVDYHYRHRDYNLPYELVVGNVKL
jgi:hypothetical protein